MRKRLMKRNPAPGRGFDRLYTLIAAVGIAAVFFPVWNIGTGLLHIPTLPGLLLYAGLLLLGYLLGLPFAKRRSGGYDFTFEGVEESGGDRLRPVIPCAVFLAAVILLRGVLRRYCEGLPNYVSGSILPYVAMLFAALVPIGGVFLSMRPFYKLLNLRYLVFYLTVFGIFGIGLPLLGYSDTPVLLSSFLVFVCCAALVLNQTHLLESVKRAGNTGMPVYFRLYNFGMILLLLLFSLFLLLLFSFAANGLFAILKMIGYSLVYAFLNRDGDGKEILTPSEGDGAAAGGLFENPFLDGASVYFFLLIFILALCFFIFGRSYHPLRRISSFFRRLSEMLNRLFDGFSGKALFRASRRDEIPPDFVDEVKRQDPDAVYDRAVPSPKESRREFERALAGCKKDDERLLLCYRRLLFFLRKREMGILPSDTPREILGKIRAHLSFPEAEEITALFEEICYAERLPSRASLPPLIEKMREMIKK